MTGIAFVFCEPPAQTSRMGHYHALGIKSKRACLHCLHQEGIERREAAILARS